MVSLAGSPSPGTCVSLIRNHRHTPLASTAMKADSSALLRAAARPGLTSFDMVSLNAVVACAGLSRPVLAIAGA